MAYHQLRIAKIVQETPDARSFVLEVPADIADKFSYRAGQFLTFQVPHESGAFNRCYSLSSAPETDGKHLKVTVKRVAGGKDQVLAPRVGSDLHTERCTLMTAHGECKCRHRDGRQVQAPPPD